MEHETIGRLYAQRQLSWHQAAKRIIKSQQDAEDIVQEAVYRTLRSNAEFPDQKTAEHYVFKALRTVAFEHLRSKARTRVQHLSAAAAESVESAALDPEATLLAKEQQQQFNAALKCLSADQRHIIEMFLQAESARSLTALSRKTGIPISTLRSRIQSGVRRIKEHILGKG